MKKFIFRSVTKAIILSTFLTGCLTPINHRALTVNELTLQNHTAATIRNIRVHVAKTKAFAQCSHIYANGEYTTSFQVKRYQGNPVTVSWETNGRENKSDEFYASIPDVIKKDKPATVRIIFNKDGTVFAALVQ